MKKAPALQKPKIIAATSAQNAAANNGGFFIQGISAKPASKQLAQGSGILQGELKKPTAVVTPQKKPTGSIMKQSPVVSAKKSVVPQQLQLQQQQLQPNVKASNGKGNPPAVDLAPKITQLANNQVNQNLASKEGEQQKQIENVQVAAVIVPEPVKEVPAPVVADTFGKVFVKYNHYNNEFDIKNGKLSFATIDEQYCFSFVFKGNYGLRLKLIATKEYVNSENKEFSGLEDKGKYAVEVDEDPVEAEKETSRPYVAPKKEDDPLKKKNQRMDDITGQLKGMSIEELKAKGDNYKQLIEARDLEDVLFS